MTIHPRQLVNTANNSNDVQKKHLHLDEMDAYTYGKKTIIYTPTDKTIDDIYAFGNERLNGIASATVIRKVASHNPNSLWAVCRSCQYDACHPKVDGFIAFLFLRKEGLKRLADGTLNRTNPDLSLLATQNERPAGIYVWCTCINPQQIGSLALAYEKLNSPLYKDISLYAWSATDDGRRLIEAVGYVHGAPLAGAFAKELYFFPRGKDRKNVRPRYDTYIPGAGSKISTVTIARTMEDFARIISIRSAVYIAEQDCPYEEEFDGNDLSGTQLIGYIGDEPAGCMRVRYFGTFAKIERLAVRHEFRRSPLAFKLVRAGIDLCQDKGYRQLYGHSRKDLVNFWRRFGFEPIPDRPEFSFSDVAYVEISMEMPPLNHAISIGNDPYVIIRPEGRWDLPGILDKSASRGISQ